VLGLVCWELTRLSRDFDDSQYFIAKIRRAGYLVHSISDHIPPGSVGKLVETFYLVAAEDERKRLGQRISGSFRYLVHTFHVYPMGSHYHTGAPVGYRFERFKIGTRPNGDPHMGKRLIPDPELAPLVQTAFTLRAAGRSLQEIHQATHLYAGVRSYSRLFGSSLYIGRWNFHGEIVEGFCPALVDLPTWSAVQEIQEQCKNRYGPGQSRRSTSSYLLSGLARCAHCNSPLNGHSKGGSRPRPLRYYICLGYIHKKCDARLFRADDLEKKVVDRLLELLSRPVVLEDLRNNYTKHLEKADESRRSLLVARQAERAQLSKHIHNLVDVIREDGYSSRSLVAELKDLEDKESALLEDIAKIKEAAPVRAVTPDIDELRTRMKSAIEHGDSRQLQLFLRNVIVSVTVDNDLKGELTYSLGFEGSVSL